jgi:cytochrome oxidase Cu insertion factor (SCO1/SenC/PrrC family)
MPKGLSSSQRICLMALLTFLLGLAGPVNAAGLPPLRVKVGDKAPNFTLISSDGKPVSLSDFAGRNVLIDFYRGYW